jgi:predicted nucleic acid-binding protein
MVLDASMAIAWLFKDEQSPAVMEIMNRAAVDGVIVPALWRLEIASVLRTAVRRQRCDQAFAETGLRRLAKLPIELDLETDAHAWGRTRALSQEEGLTPYDAAYLELALRLSRPLASNDGDLIAAARRRGVEVLVV